MTTTIMKPLRTPNKTQGFSRMSKRKQMYGLLEDMFEGAEEGDKERVLELNRLFNKLVDHGKSDCPPQLDLEYDNCRQSFVLSVLYSSDARERLLRIPKPEH